MVNRQFMGHVATTLRRYPWVMVVGRALWRLARPKFSVGVVGVVFNAEGHVLMVEHVFHPYRPWGLPGGWVERDEHPPLTLKREFSEELQLDVVVGSVVAVGSELPNHLDLAYVCHATDTAVGALSFELLSHRWFDPDHLPQTHAFHVQAVQQAQHLLSLKAELWQQD